MSEAGLGPATELEVELSPRAEFRAQSSPVHSHMPRQRERKKRPWLDSIVTKVALYLHSRMLNMNCAGDEIQSDGIHNS